MTVPSEQLVIRPYRDGDAPRILALFNEVFAEGDPNFHERTLAEWEWEFVHNPAGEQIVVAEEPDTGRIVAQYACLPAWAHLCGRRVWIGQGIDSVVHKDYRRGLKREGAFLRTAKYYFDHIGIPEKNAWGYGFPNSKAFGIGVKLLKYVPIAAPVPTLFRNLFQCANDDEVGTRASSELRVVEVARFGPEADAFWARLEPLHPMAIRRDAAYLNWRHVDNPLTKSVALELVDATGALRGLCVLRPDWTGPPILALSEWLVEPTDDAATSTLLRHVTQWARSHGQQRIEVWVPPSHPQFEAIQREGFCVESSPFNLCIKMYLPELTEDWVRSHWYWTIGDSDVF